MTKMSLFISPPFFFRFGLLYGRFGSAFLKIALETRLGRYGTECFIGFVAASEANGRVIMTDTME